MKGCWRSAGAWPRGSGCGAPRLMVSGTVDTPFLAVVCRPAVVLPAGLAGGCHPEQLPLVLAHELAHLRRCDLWWSWLPAAAQVLFWFHPLVWLSGREWRLAQEMACDELALRASGADAADYGALLLRTAAISGARPRHRWLAVGVLETYETLKRRLDAMKTISKMTHRQWLWTGLLLATVGVAVLVPWRVTAQDAKVGGDPAAADRESSRRLKHLGRALLMYAQDWDLCLPPMQSPEALIKRLLPYAKDPGKFFDPHAGQPYVPNPAVSERRVAILFDPHYRMLAPHQVRSRDPRTLRRLAGHVEIERPWQVAGVYEPAAAPDGARGVLFVDGHVERVPKDSWEKLLPASGLKLVTSKQKPGFAAVDEFFLLPFPTAREEIRLTPRQKTALEPLMKQSQRQRALAVLTPVQRQRLHQLVLRVNRGPALLRPEVVVALKLSSEQQRRIRNILVQHQYIEQTLIAQGNGPGATREQTDTMVRELPLLRQRAYEEALKVLSDDQRARWEQMIGPPWELGAIIVRG
jgi:prepilin-type processing-associated H-X9-DG protein